MDPGPDSGPDPRADPTRLAFRELAASELELANAIYAQLGFAPSDPGRERTFAGLATTSPRPVALGRICEHEDGALELGGFWVHPELRGKGVARRAVAHVISKLPRGREAWCVPFVHLEAFYRSFGMRPPHPGETPPGSLLAKLRRCEQTRVDGRPLPATTLLRLPRTVPPPSC